MLMEKQLLPIQSHLLVFMMLSFGMMLCFSNWFDARLVYLFGLTTDAGTLIFPLTFLLSDLITEVYGYKLARRAIWYGFLFNIIYFLYGQLITHLPSPQFANQNEMFDKLLSINSRIIFASIFSYALAEPINSYTLAKLKVKMHGRLMPIRFLISTLLSASIDSITFAFVAFYKLYPNDTLLKLVVSTWFLKIVIELIGLPLSIYLAHKLKKYEKLDIYDTRTKFNLFSLNTDYVHADNLYKPS